MTPKKLYQQLIDEGKIQFDEHQQAALDQLERICIQLNKKSRWRRWFNFPVKGLYCWGPVGVGKTLLMDLLNKTIAVKKKRMHFYLFMQYVHEQLRKFQGQKNPLRKIAKQISLECSLIMFDEFYVKNIADAMILGNLLKALFENHVCFVATSNTEPDKLYWDGLQREQFLPAIEEIKQHCEVLELKAHHDYRLVGVIDNSTYFCPQNPAQIQRIFQHLSQTHHTSNEPLVINDRSIEIHQRTSNVLWIDFTALCSVPRSSADYAILVKKYSPIIIDRIRQIEEHENNLISNFIQFIDIAYDNKIHCVFSSDVAIDQIYPTGKYKQDFQRTRSRIHEMQTKEYLRQEH